MATGLQRFWDNVRRTPQSVREAAFRNGPPTSSRTRSQTIFNNFFLHIHSVRTHPRSLRITTTWGLGISLLS